MSESFYGRHILPRIIAKGCGCEMVERKRAQIVPFAAGRVLELGVGGGRNFKYYNPDLVSEVVGIDPSQTLRQYAQAAERPSALRVEIMDGDAGHLPFEAETFDTVLTTYTLCSVPDEMLALCEARRVLRPGGQILFCEHGRTPDLNVARWQRRVEPIWKWVFGNCHLTRPVGQSVAKCFALDRLESGYMESVPRLAGWMEWGRAVAA